MTDERVDRSVEDDSSPLRDVRQSGFGDVEDGVDLYERQGRDQPRKWESSAFAALAHVDVHDMPPLIRFEVQQIGDFILVGGVVNEDIDFAERLQKRTNISSSPLT